MKKFVVDATEIKKIYQMGAIQVHALCGLSLKVRRGEIVAIMGPSGSGKSTLMNILGCLDRPTRGKYILDGERVENLVGNQLADIRNRKVGFIFQSYNLLSRSTALANVQLPMRYSRNGQIDLRKKSEELLARVGLHGRIHHKPTELSGGEQQRVAIARALANDPSIIMADEPTGNLDSKTGKEIMQLLMGLNKEQGVTLIVVTHDPIIAEYADRIIQIMDGKIAHE
jgi:putative ABC transport system ATP-binding protein